jgi:hypothetical protein
MLAFMLRRALLLLCAVLGSNFVTAAEIAVPGDYPTIQDAIDAAEQDDVVLIDPGTYEENPILRGDIELRGRETARTLLMPSDAGPILTIQGVSGVTVTNLTLVDATTGLLVTNVADLVIRNLVFEGASDAAIDIDASVDVAIEHCVFYGNATAIRRLAVDSIIENNLFAANAVTIASPLGAPVTNVRSNGFFDNDDLKQGDVDTGLGTDFQVGDPRFVDVDAHDYHVRAGSPAIDTGTGDDVIDDTVADLGVYGGEEADPTPFPVSGLTLDDASATNPPPFALEVSWDANLDYRITSDSMPGRYRVYYQQNQAGPPYDGDDGANGTEPSPVDVGPATSYRLEQLMPEVGAPPVPMLTAAEPRSESIVLEWNDVAGASGYRVFWGTASTAENSLDLGDVTRTTITGLVNGTVYRFAVAALRRPVYHVAVSVADGTTGRHESELSDEATTALGPASASGPSNELTASPATTTPIPDLPDGGGACFIATAAYGADFAPEVAILRDFRDRYLATNRAGRTFIAWYYAHGPTGAAYLARHAGAKAVVRIALEPVVFGVLALTAGTPLQLGMLAALAFAFGIARRQARTYARGLE